MTGPLDLEPIKARLAAAAPGPWYVTSEDGIGDERGAAIAVGPYGVGIDEPDAALIAHAPTDIAALIAEVERLRDGLESVVLYGPDKTRPEQHNLIP